MKAPSPLLGFNNNVRHKGRVFHIQTEDSGVRHPHIITHLFADGGRILKTTKTSYAEHIGHERIGETVRAMMQDQHKAMFIALRDGQYDHLIEDGRSKSGLDAVKAAASSAPDVARPLVPAAFEAPDAGQALAPPPSAIRGAHAVASAPMPPGKTEDPPIPPRSPPVVPAGGKVDRADARVVVEPPHTATQRPPPMRSIEVAADTPMPPGKGAPYAPTEPARRAAGTPVQRPDVVSGGPPSYRRSGRPTLDVDPSAIHRAGTGSSEPDLDLDALERAAAEAHAPVFQQIQNLPPPPAAVLAGKRGSSGGYSSRTSPPPPVVRRVLTPGGRPAIPSPNRYAPSRPASIFATTRPNDGASIFGEDLISEKSLDEVILGYLAEDLDGPAEKK